MVEVKIGDWLRDGWDLVKDDWVTFAVSGLLVWLIGTQACAILYGPMMVGYHILCFRRMRGERAEIEGLGEHRADHQVSGGDHGDG